VVCNNFVRRALVGVKIVASSQRVREEYIRELILVCVVLKKFFFTVVFEVPMLKDVRYTVYGTH